MVAINPLILKWARETAGLSLSEGSRKIGLNDARGKKGFERLDELERGEVQPSRDLLLKMSKHYRRSLLVFYLKEPPATGDRGQDFRTLPGAKEHLFDADLDALLRDIKVRQSIVKSLLEDTEEETVSFVGSATMANIEADSLAKLITKHIQFSLSEFRSQKSEEPAFAYLRTKIEAAGVFVLLLGNLGSHHTNIDTKIFRGFAIADPVAPFIVVNDQDSKIAWAFTALHELTHIWLGTSGISGESDRASIEKYCNEVAGEILLPSSDMSRLSNVQWTSLEDSVIELSRLARECNVSRSMVAYKLYRSGLITTDRWTTLKAHLTTQKTAPERQTSKGGPDYYVFKRHRLGSAILGLINRSLANGLITYTKAGQVLGVKPTNVHPLLSLNSLQSGG